MRLPPLSRFGPTGVFQQPASLFVSMHFHDFRIVAERIRTAHLPAPNRSQDTDRPNPTTVGLSWAKKGEMARTASVQAAPHRAGYAQRQNSCPGPAPPRKQRRRPGQASIAAALSVLGAAAAPECPLPAAAAFDQCLLAREWGADPLHPNAFCGLLR